MKVEQFLHVLLRQIGNVFALENLTHRDSCLT